MIQTMMSTALPPEILDLIFDLLGYESHTLKACCLVSKSWIPRTQKRLFAHIKFINKSHVKRWRKSFPDPSKFPAHYARSLSFRDFSGVTDAGVNIGSWIHVFRHVVHLSITTVRRDDSRVSLVQLRGFSPNLKSFRLSHSSIPLSEVFNFVCSFPLLEDLHIISRSDTDGGDEWDIPSASPKLTGSLEIRGKGTRSTVRRLCDLPGGLRFSNVTVSCYKEDVQLITDLVSRCSDTLESFTVSYGGPSGTSRTPLDLSKATKLKGIDLSCSESDAQWVNMAVQTATSESLQQINVTLRADPSHIGGMTHREWQDLDCLLIQLWTSRSIRPKVTYEMGYGESSDAILYWLPGLRKGGFVKVVEHDWVYYD